MITLFRTDKIQPLSELKSLMAAQIRQLPQMISPTGEPLKILRYEFQCEPINLLFWVHNQKVPQKIYWSDRKGEFEVAGIGTADSIEGNSPVNYKELFEYMEDRLSADNPHLRYYGGFSFNEALCDNDWTDFANYRFFIPQFELCQNKGATTFAFNIAIKNINDKTIENVVNQLSNVDFTESTHYRSVPIVQSRSDYPDKKMWNSMFDTAMHQLHQSRFEKIVLARKSTFEFDKSIDPMALIKHLKDITPNCYHFCFQTGEYQGFLGATPERLYKRVENSIETEAIAGTKPKGQTPDGDEQIKRELLSSDKETHEHQLVVEKIKRDLQDLCESIQTDNTFQLLQLKSGHHLITRMKGKLYSTVRDNLIIQNLHPTPAVAGFPVKQTIEAIEAIEPFNRGWYAGPIGYVGNDTVEFAVGIRSSLINKRFISLYAGAGIVKGSDVENEWNEIENKIKSFIDVFRL